MMFIRSGSCSQCGDCCGSELAANPCNPWPTWPTRVASWQYSVFEDLFKYASFVGLVQAVDGTVQIAQNYGNIKVPAKGTFYWIWVQEKGLCTDLPTYGDPATYSVKCPFLMANTGTPTVPVRPCAIGEAPQFASQWGMVCGWRKDVGDMSAEELVRHGSGNFYNQQSVDQWMNDHPHCTFVWTEEG